MSLYFLLTLYLLDLHTGHEGGKHKKTESSILTAYQDLMDQSLILPCHLKASLVTHFFTLICWNQPCGMSSTGISAQRCIEYCFWPELLSCFLPFKKLSRLEKTTDLKISKRNTVCIFVMYKVDL